MGHRLSAFRLPASASWSHRPASVPADSTSSTDSIRVAASVAVATIFALAPSAYAGPNADGFLVFHTDDHVSYTWEDVASYADFAIEECPRDDCSRAEECLGFAFSIDPTASIGSRTEPAVFWLLAAFPWTDCPRVRGVSFGLDWDPSFSPVFVGDGNCEGVSIAEPGWPSERNSGVSVYFAWPHTEHIFPVYWFAAYAYYGAKVEVTSRGSAAAPEFADDGAPALIDEVPWHHLGAMGLGGHYGDNPMIVESPVAMDSWGGVKRRFIPEEPR
ncbi:MAG: hypothetical protein R3E97_03145 [Candidatus Eisenbacteria bacterium]